MKSRLFPIILVVVIFVVGVGLGRYVILPALRGNTQPAVASGYGPQRLAAARFASPIKPRVQSIFDECMGEMIDRRSDPIEARNVCNVISQSLE